jgi:hypothetical protein
MNETKEITIVLPTGVEPGDTVRVEVDGLRIIISVLHEQEGAWTCLAQDELSL